MIKTYKNTVSISEVNSRTATQVWSFEMLELSEGRLSHLVLGGINRGISLVIYPIVRSYCKFVNNGDELDISVKMLFQQKNVHVNNYGKIVTLLNETLAVLNQDIIFEKL